MRSIRHLIAGAIAVVATAAVVVWNPSAILAGITVELTDFVIDPGKSLLT
jgi:hypothetical protein